MAGGGTGLVIMGVFVADVTFRAPRLPNMGETLMGTSFVSGPGGKGSNQSVAAARAGADVSFLARIGGDTFGDIARSTWADAGVVDQTVRSDTATGAAMIYVDDGTGDNAIILVPGAGGELSPEDVEAKADVIRSAAVFITQLEQPHATALAALEVARDAGVVTVLNPAPAPEPIDPAFYRLCDYMTPNESEAEGMTGVRVGDVDEARKAGDAILEKGAGCALLTLGERGALAHGGEVSELVPAFDAGPVKETTGAGDAFNGALGAALAEGRGLLDAARFACACASISVTRPGTAPSMPARAEIDALLAS